jgi:orotate phosphoribosyltransferase
LSARERSALKDLIILDLLHALGNDAFFVMIAGVALKGDPISPEVVRHLLDEAPKYADKMSPEVNALMGKIAGMPQR